MVWGEFSGKSCLLLESKNEIVTYENSLPFSVGCKTNCFRSKSMSWQWAACILYWEAPGVGCQSFDLAHSPVGMAPC
jgi:hypothetical protein